MVADPRTVSGSKTPKPRVCEAVTAVFQSGKSEIRNRDFSVQLNRNPYPNLGFAYNYQDFWNERQGTQISHLYTSGLRYELGSKLGVNVQYRHEDVLANPETATETSSTPYYRLRLR